MAMSQEDIVLSFVQGVDGAAWADERTGWNAESAESVCKWDGITCDHHDSIVSIDLERQDLSATIPTELGLLHSLTHLNLQGNPIYGSIPYEVGTLKALEVINLSSTLLDGTIPIFMSPNLRELVLAYSHLEGTIPFLFGEGHGENLAKLDFSSNSLTGSIPSSLGNMSKLLYLDLSSNQLQGSLPAEIGNLGSLQGLFLDNNRLLGRIPPALSRSQNLFQIFLHKNDFSGTIPAALADLPNLLDLFIDGNKFTGTVPQELCDRYLNKDFFEGHPSGNDRDGCTSVACPANTKAFQGIFPCHTCAESFLNPYLGSNQCIGLEQRDILRNMYNEMNGDDWLFASSWQLANEAGWAENINICDMEGVDCNSAGHVVGINLANKNLSGMIPESVGFLRYLRSLNLADNSLTGYLPSDLRWAPLEELDISGNKLEGFVPPSLCEKSDINGNGIGGQFSCDILTCPAGTFNEIGRASPGGPVQSNGDIINPYCVRCLDADQAQYLGQKACENVSVQTAPVSGVTGLSDIALIGIIMPIIAVVLVMAFYGFRKYKRMKHRRETEYYNSNGVSSKSVFAEFGAKQSSGSVFDDDKKFCAANVKNTLAFDITSERISDKEVWLDVPRARVI